ncbi:MAG: hypothetical protein RPU59_13405, partial [Candidatus Sedimenticola sp. (ex Thyasira tokunagai)]
MYLAGHEGLYIRSAQSCIVNLDISHLAVEVISRSIHGATNQNIFLPIKVRDAFISDSDLDAIDVDNLITAIKDMR